MPRDYSKKKPAKRRPSATPKSSTKSPTDGLVYLAIGLIVGLFIAFLVFLDKVPEEKSKDLAHPAKATPAMKKSQLKLTEHSSKLKQKKRKQTKTIAKPKQIPNKARPLKPIPKVPKYEFYTMLPDVEVEVDVPEIINKPTINKTTKITQLKQKNTRATTHTQIHKPLYQLQVGAFQEKQKAESIKAQLAFMGVQSQISSSWLSYGSPKRAKRVYKVAIGPSSDEKKLRFIKAKLKKANINTYLKKL